MTDKSEPRTLVAGDSWAWRREDLVERYPAPTWTLTYHYASAAFAFSITATADGEAFAIAVPATTTKDYAPGDYQWDAYVDDGTDRYRVDSGKLTVDPDLATAGPLDLRSDARATLEALDAMIRGKASKDQQSYTIGSRSLSRMDPAELIKWRDYYAGLVAREDEAERIEAGLKSGRTVLTRFTGA